MGFREAVLLPRPPVVCKVPLADLCGEDGYVRVMSARQRDLFESQNKRTEGDDRNLLERGMFRSAFVAACACNEKGEPVFQAIEAAVLMDQDQRIINRLFEAGWELNGMGDEGVKQAEKNSEPIPDASSSGDSV